MRNTIEKLSHSVSQWNLLINEATFPLPVAVDTTLQLPLQLLVSAVHEPKTSIAKLHHTNLQVRFLSKFYHKWSHSITCQL